MINENDQRIIIPSANLVEPINATVPGFPFAITRSPILSGLVTESPAAGLTCCDVVALVVEVCCGGRSPDFCTLLVFDGVTGKRLVGNLLILKNLRLQSTILYLCLFVISKKNEIVEVYLLMIHVTFLE